MRRGDYGAIFVFLGVVYLLDPTKIGHGLIFVGIAQLVGVIMTQIVELVRLRKKAKEGWK